METLHFNTTTSTDVEMGPSSGFLGAQEAHERPSPKKEEPLDRILDREIMKDFEDLKQVADNVGLVIDSLQTSSSYLIRFALDTSFLQKFTATQWGLDSSKPVIVQLQFREDYLRSGEIPPINVYQSADSNLYSQKLQDHVTDFGVVQWFLETRLSSILKKNWKIRRLNGIKDAKTKQIQLEQLRGLGFSEREISSVLERAKGDIDIAIDLLLNKTQTDQPTKDVPLKMDVNTTPTSNNNNSNNNNTPVLPTSWPEFYEMAKEEKKIKETLDGLRELGFDPQAISKEFVIYDTGTRTHHLKRLSQIEFDHAMSILLGELPNNLPTLITTQDHKNPNGSAIGPENDLKVLISEGFSEKETRIALDAAAGDISIARELLLDQFSDNVALQHHHPAAPFFPKKRRHPYPHGNVDQNTPKKLKSPPKIKKEDELEFKDESEDLFGDSVENAATFLSRLHNYIKLRFITCPLHCLVCDVEMDGHFYKLPVCGDSNCVSTYESSHFCGGNVLSEIKKQPDSVDLLINLLMAAATANQQTKGLNRDSPHHFRRGFRGGALSRIRVRGVHRTPLNLASELDEDDEDEDNHDPMRPPASSFEPFPHGIGFDNNRQPDVRLLIRVLDLIPPVKTLAAIPGLNDDVLKQELDKINPLCFPLLRWVVRSNRSHISLIPAKHQAKVMETDLQFQLVSSFPEHEQDFQNWKKKAQSDSRLPEFEDDNDEIIPVEATGRLKKKVPPKQKPLRKGSYLAFHGSPISNWHSIVRTGLKSGFVPGIYHAQQASVSYGYMAVGSTGSRGWKNSMWKTNHFMSCISVIEVADFRHDQKKVTGGFNHHNGVNVAMDDSLVVSRYLFFYPTGPKGSNIPDHSLHAFPMPIPFSNNLGKHWWTRQDVVASKLPLFCDPSLIENSNGIDDDEEDEDVQLVRVLGASRASDH